ncbi:hypothetical protein ES708_31948 [subsurface metagenome]
MSKYRDFMKACMLKQNVKGKSAEEVRLALTECAQAWTRQIEAKVAIPFDIDALAKSYLGGKK